MKVDYFANLRVYRARMCLLLQIRRALEWLLFLLFLAFTAYCLRTLIDTIPKKLIVDWKSKWNGDAVQFVKPNQSTTLTNPVLASHSLILIVVCSAPENSELRKAIRETWAANTTHVQVVFLLGISGIAEVDSDVINESIVYNDVVVEDFIESYENLTLKSIFLLKWINRYSSNVQFLMKVDDDAYLNVPNLVRYVISLSSVDGETFLNGKLYKMIKPMRSLISKWYVPYDVFPDNYYPNFLCGVGYIMSNKVAKRLYEVALNTGVIFIEDLFITGFCAQKAGIIPSDNIAFHFMEHPVVDIECNSVHQFMIILSHHNKAADLKRQHEEIIKCFAQYPL